MLETLIAILVFLINTAADFCTFVLIARVILVWVHADYFNPLTQLVAKLTDFAVLRVKRFIPTVKDVELSSLLLIFLLEFVKFILIGLLLYRFPSIVGLTLLCIAEILKLTINVFFYAILVQVILSWFPYQYTQVYNLLAIITAPILRPLRHFLKPYHGFDISPVFALIGLQLIVFIFIDQLLYSSAKSLAFG